MKRIAVIGAGGTGKSTFAVKLGCILNIPVIHLDVYYWQPNWTRTEDSEWEVKQQELLKSKTWIAEGNYRRTFDLRFKPADTIIFLDYPKWLCLWRIVKRRVRYHNKTRSDLGGDNTDRLSWSFVKWVSSYPRQETRDKLKTYAKDKEIYIFRSPKQTEQFLAELKATHTQ